MRILQNIGVEEYDPSTDLSHWEAGFCNSPAYHCVDCDGFHPQCDYYSGQEFIAWRPAPSATDETVPSARLLAWKKERGR